MKRGSHPSLRILQPRPDQLRKGEEEQYDPRGQRSPSSPGDLATRRPARQCDSGLSGSRDFPHTLLPVAPAVSALWRRRAAPPADTPDPLAAPSDPRARACGPGLCAVVAHAGTGPSRHAIAAAPVGRLAHQRLGRLRDPQAARLADALGAAHAAGGPRRDRRPADRPIILGREPDEHPGGLTMRRDNDLFLLRITKVPRQRSSAPRTAPARPRSRFAIAAGGEIAPPSPTPFTPWGLRGDGCSKWTVLMRALLFDARASAPCSTGRTTAERCSPLTGGPAMWHGRVARYEVGGKSSSLNRCRAHSQSISRRTRPSAGSASDVLAMG